MGGKDVAKTSRGHSVIDTKGWQVRTFPNDPKAAEMQSKVLKIMRPYKGAFDDFNVSVTSDSDVPAGAGSKNGIYRMYFRQDLLRDDQGNIEIPDRLKPRTDTGYVNPGLRQGRGQPCPCGSGYKAKRCCGVNNEAIGTITIDNFNLQTQFFGQGIGKQAIRDLHNAGFNIQASNILPDSRGFWDRIGFRTISAEEYIEMDPLMIDWPGADMIEGTYGPHGFPVEIPDASPENLQKTRIRKASENMDLFQRAWDNPVLDELLKTSVAASPDAVNNPAALNPETSVVVLFGSGDKGTTRQTTYGWLDAREPMLRLRTLAAVANQKRYNREPTGRFAGRAGSGRLDSTHGWWYTHVYNPVTGNVIQNNRRNRQSITRQQIKAGRKPTNYIVGRQEELYLWRDTI